MIEKREVVKREDVVTSINQAAIYSELPLDDDYFALVRVFPLVSIHDDAHLTKALAVVDRLVDQSNRSSGEESYLSALTDLVETYENARISIPASSGVEVLRHLMEENDLSQSDLAPIFGTPSIISDVLSGKRRLALSHIRRLSEHFGLPADAFIDGA